MDSAVPEKLMERYGGIVDDRKRFLDYLKRPLPRAFRVNTLKAETGEVLESLKGYGFPVKKVPWSSNAFVTEKEGIGSTIEHFMGYLYVQELVSMLPPIVLEKELKEVGEAVVLDACAAPGSKTTQLSAIMDNRGLIVANDSSFGRMKILKHNMEKLGCMNIVAVNRDARFLKTGMEFGFVLLDAVCSSEGIFRKNFNALSRWGEKRIKYLANMQRQMITNCFDMLAPGGVMIYSTCTYAPEENEGVVDYLLGRKDCSLEKVRIRGLKTGRPVKSWEGRDFGKEVSKAVRVWPHHNDTGGFFLARIRRGS